MISKLVGHGVAIGKWYFAKDSSHAKNEVLYVSLAHDSILIQLNTINVTNKKCELLQCCCILHLSDGHPIITYESMKSMFK